MTDAPDTTGPAGTTRTFASTFEAVAGVQGWMTRAQAGRLWDAASRLGAGAQVVEIGSFHGRSAIVLACAASLAFAGQVLPAL